MAGAKKGPWIGGTVFVSAVVMAAAWFLAVHPTMAQAADLRGQTDQVKSSNDNLSVKIDRLAQQFQKLPQFQKDLDQVRTQVPTTGQLSDYLRQLDQIAGAHAVVLTTVTPGAPQAFAPAAVANPTPSPSASGDATDTATAGTDSGTDAGTDTSATPAPAVAPAFPAGLSAIPMSVTVVGSYDNTLAFLNDLQTATPRLFLVSGFTGTALKQQDGAAGRPATLVGDQELTVTGFLYVLPDDGATAPKPVPSATPGAPTLPAPVPGKNPLVPIAG